MQISLLPREIIFIGKVDPGIEILILQISKVASIHVISTTFKSSISGVKISARSWNLSDFNCFLMVANISNRHVCTELKREHQSVLFYFPKFPDISSWNPVTTASFDSLSVLFNNIDWRIQWRLS